MGAWQGAQTGPRAALQGAPRDFLSVQYCMVWEKLVSDFLLFFKEIGERGGGGEKNQPPPKKNCFLLVYGRPAKQIKICFRIFHIRVVKPDFQIERKVRAQAFSHCAKKDTSSQKTLID